MGLSGIGISQLLVILAIVVLIFGTRRFRQAGGDIGGMIRGVREGFGKDATLEDVAKDVKGATDELKKAKDILDDNPFR